MGEVPLSKAKCQTRLTKQCTTTILGALRVTIGHRGLWKRLSSVWRSGDYTRLPPAGPGFDLGLVSMSGLTP